MKKAADGRLFYCPDFATGYPARMGTLFYCLLGIFLLLQFVAAYSDVRTRTIPNWITLAVGLSGACFIFLAELQDLQLAWYWHVVTATAVLILGFVLFATNVFGGGDAKLLAANALWAGPDLAGGMLLLVALFGGVLATGWWIALHLRKYRANRSGRLPPVNHFSVNLPYGLAIAAGAVFVGWRLLEQIP